MLFDKNGFYVVDDNYNQDYDFAINLINGTGGTSPDSTYDFKKTNFRIYDLEEALKKGNAFPNLYSEYKGYRPKELKATNAREKALLDIQMLEFSITDLNLYLDLNPQDKQAYRLFSEYIETCKKKKKAYTDIYGPLVLDDLTEDYEWSKGVWPWEEGIM